MPDDCPTCPTCLWDGMVLNRQAIFGSSPMSVRRFTNLNMPFTRDCPRKSSIFSMIIRISHQKIIHLVRDDPPKTPFRWWISMVAFCFPLRFQAASDWPSSSKTQRLASWPWWKPWTSPGRREMWQWWQCPGRRSYHRWGFQQEKSW